MKIVVRKNNGITLIALVITIIVLLILAGVTIASLAGENGLLNRATGAKNVTTKATGKEQIQMEVFASYGLDGNINMDLLNTNLRNIAGLTYNNSALSDSNKITSLPADIKLNGYTYIIDENVNIETEEPHIYSAEVTGKLKIDTTQTDDYKISPYVEFNGELYRVLYDIDSGYGWIELVSVNPLSTVTLGCKDSELPITSPQGYDFSGTDANFEKARWSYNNAITTLNKKAQKYLDTSVADRARCVGSDPKFPAKDITELTYTNNYSYMSTYGCNKIFKVPDTNYAKENSLEINRDWDQLGDIGARDYSTSENYSYYYYWLASRNILPDAWYIDFCIRCGDFSGYLGDSYLCSVHPNGSKDGLHREMGFRPVIRLKSGIKITGDGDGTSEHPYELTM